MKFLRIISGILAALLAAGAVWLTMTFCGQLPVVLAVPAEASRTVEQTMDALCTGDYDTAQQLLYGIPDLGTDTQPEDMVNRMIWEAYRNSLDYRMVGELYAAGQGLAQDVKIIHMELSTATENLGQRARQLLQQRVETAQDVSEIYGADHAYRESVIDEILEEAVRQALEEDVRYTYQTVTLQLVCREGKWWVMPDEALLNAVFGGIAG